MKKLFATLSMILGFITVVSAQNTAKPSEALTAKPVTKEVVATEKKETTTPNALPVKEVKPVEVTPIVATMVASPVIEATPAKVVPVEKPVTNNVKTVKVVPVEKVVEVKPAKTKN